MLGQRGLDFAQFDAEAAHLHLGVAASEELNGPVGAVAGLVARAVHARAGPGAERVRDEALHGEVRPSPVTARHLEAADVQLAGDSYGYGLQVRVEQVDARVGDGRADEGQVGPRLGVSGEDAEGGEVSLRRAVLVVQHGAGQPLHQQAQGRGDAKLLAGGDDFLEVTGHQAVLLGDLGEVLKGDEGKEHSFHAAGVHQLQEGVSVAADVLGDEHQLTAAGPGGEHLLKGDVEAEGGELEGAA